MKKKIKILQIGMTTNIGGIETYLFEVFKRINKEQFQVDFLTFREKSLMAFEDDIVNLGGKVYKITSHRKSVFLYLYELFTFFNKNKDYDIVIYNTLKLTNISYIIFAKINGIPMRAVHAHMAFFDIQEKNFFHKILIFFNEKILRMYATHLFACSHSAGKWMFKNRDYQIMNNAIDLEKFKFSISKRNEIRTKLGLDKMIVIGNIARFGRQKNHKFLIDIYYEIYKKNKNTALLLIGEGELQDFIKNKVEKLGLNNNVFFLGKQVNVNEYLQGMDIFILPSIYEGLPITLIEAQAMGLKCFVSKDVISEEVNVSNLVDFISLDSPASLWADIVLEKSIITNSRINISNLLSEAGYNIEFEIGKIENYYLEELKKLV